MATHGRPDGVRAWIFDEHSKETDQRAPHQTTPVQWVKRDTLDRLGVFQWSMTNPNPEHPELKRIRGDRNYKGHDFVTISREKLPNYDEKLKIFFDEHLHDDEEIRYVLEGSGYFDVRNSFDANESWVRIEVLAGDMIVLPAGVYHRFTLDEKNYISVMRLFQDVPVWTAHSRKGGGEVTEAKKARSVYKEYVTKVAADSKLPVASAVKGLSNGMNGTHDSKTASATATITPAGPNGIAYIVNDGAKALANYPHMRQANGFLYVSGLSSRRPDNTHRGATQNPSDGSWVLDIAEQTRGCIENLKLILSTAGANLSHVVDMNCFLTDMKNYDGFNKAYNSYFADPTNSPTRTTVAVKELPHPRLLVELKAVAVIPK
jgi:1,2-dihydroxy-3-keto-5-methylthiopentene dioxygenase